MTILAKRPPTPSGQKIGGLPAYTRQQFLQVRPGGNYQAYLNFLRRKRGVGAGAATQATAAAPAPTYASLLGRVQIETPAQIEARAGRMTNASLAAQQKIIRDQQDRARIQALQQMQAQSNAGRAAAAMNAGLLNTVGAEGNAAVAELGRLGALTQNVGSTVQQDVAAQNEALARVGQAPIQASAMAGPGQIGVEQYRNVSLPQANQTAQTQADQFGLTGLINAMNLRATQEGIAGQTVANRQTDAETRQALSELAAGRPEVYGKNLAALQDASRQQIALAMSLIEGQGRTKQQAFANQQAVAQTKQATAQQAFENTLAQQEMAMKWAAVDPARSAALGYVVDARGNPILKGGKRIPYSEFEQRATTAKGAGGKSLTPGQYATLMKNADALVQGLYYGYAYTKQGARRPANQVAGQTTWGEGRLGYNQTLKKLTALRVPKQDAIDLLNQYFERGQRGRPLFTNKERGLFRKQMGTRKFNWVQAQIRNLLGRGQDAAADRLIDMIVQGRGKDIVWAGPS